MTFRFTWQTLSETEMTCKFQDLGACGPILGKHITFGAAASIMAALVVTSVGLLFSGPSSAADIKADRAAIERGIGTSAS
jgi:hypothetical protein